MMKEKKKCSIQNCLLIVLLLLGLGIPQSALAQEKFTISGVVYEALPGGNRVPLPGATISIPEYGIGIASDPEGQYRLQGVPSGRATLQVSYVGKETFARQNC